MLDKNSIKVTERILSGAILSMTKCAAEISCYGLPYVFSGLAMVQVLIFGALLTFGGGGGV